MELNAENSWKETCESLQRIKSGAEGPSGQIHACKRSNSGLHCNSIENIS